jgi:hypothetical protein
MNWLTYTKNFSFVCEISKNCIWKFEWWTWWKSNLKVVNLMKIRKWWTRIWWKSIIRSSLECQFRKRLLTCKKIFHLYDKFQKRSSEKASRELD